MEECDDDPKFASYTRQIENILRQFEAFYQWHDILSALNKLKKTIQSNQAVSFIPRKQKVAKRLALCLLDKSDFSSVHKAAIGAYEEIFKTLGPNRLAQDLFIYTAGLFPALEFVDLGAKDHILKLYDTYLVPLGQRLRPCLQGLLSSIFLGTDTTNEKLTKTINALLDSICESVHPPVFFSAIWECVLVTPKVRVPATDFVLTKTKSYENKLKVEDLAYLLGSDKVIAVRSICQAIQDSRLDRDIQKRALDLLIRLFPMHYKHDSLDDSHLIELLTTVLSTKFDSKHDRRFYTWILGDNVDDSLTDSEFPQRSSTSETDDVACYFEHYSRHILVESLRQVLSKSLKKTDIIECLAPYKVLKKLFDRPEIKTFVLKDIAIDVFRAFYHLHRKFSGENRNKKSSDPDIHDVIIMEVNVLFDGGLPHDYIWKFCADLFEKSSQYNIRINDSDEVPVNGIGVTDTSVTEICELLDFMLGTVFGRGNEYLPELFKRIVVVLSKRSDKFTTDEMDRSLNLAFKIWRNVRVLLNDWIKDDDNSRERQIAFEQTSRDCVEKFQNFVVVFFRARIFDENFALGDVISIMIHRQNHPCEDRTRLLETLLSDDADVTSATAMEDESLVDKLCRKNVHLRDGVHRMAKSFSTVCQILLELFVPKFFPDVTDADFSILANSAPATVRSQPSDIPEWLQYMMISATLIGPLHAGHLLQSISSLLQLAEKRDVLVRPMADPNVAIVLSPILNKSDFTTICKRTVFPLIVTSKLWAGLEQMSPMHHQKCVKLLYQLLNTPACSGVNIEKIMSRSLTSRGANQEDGRSVGAFQRFTLFWHLSRDVIATRTETIDRWKPATQTFDVCLRVRRQLRVLHAKDITIGLMLDNLNTTSGPLKTLTETWLVHSIGRGDTARILEPLLVTLLDPSTARVSVLHCRIDLCDIIETSNADVNGSSLIFDDQATSLRLHKVFAITAANGEVIHHVTGGGGVETGRKWTDQQMPYYNLTNITDDDVTSVETAKRKFALNTFNDSVKKKNDASQDRRRTDPFGGGELDFFKTPSSINPFALVPSDTKDFESFTSGYRSATPNRSASLTTLTSDEETTSQSSSLATSQSQASLDEEDKIRIVHQILEEILNTAISQAENKVRASFDNDESIISSSKDPMVQPLHSHVLLYTQVSDSRQILFSMQCLKNIIQTNPRQVIGMLTTTNLNSAITPRRNQLQILLARHRKSVFGQAFVGDLTPENMSTYRSSTLLEVLMSTLLYYLRSFYPNLGHVQVREEIKGNREVQLMSINIITALVTELALMVKDNGRAFATFIYDLFTRCKVHKVVLHTLLASVNDTKEIRRVHQDLSFTDDILLFNEVYADGNETNTSEKISNYSEAFQIQLLRLLLALVMLEQIVSQQKGEGRERIMSESGKNATTARVSSVKANKPIVVRFFAEQVIPEQPMFLASITSALRQDKIRHLHSHWTSLVTSCLPFLGRSLSSTVLETVSQLSHNLERLSIVYSCDDSDKLVELGLIPTDYVITQLHALTVIYHYCLLDIYSQVNMAFPSPMNTSQMSGSVPSPANDILSNLRHVFLSTFDPKNLVTNSVAETSDALVNARKNLLSKLPTMIACCVTLWKSTAPSSLRESDDSCLLIGDPKVVRSHLLDFLSPIGHHHPVAFLSAVGIAWHELKDLPSSQSSRQILPTCNENQTIIVDIVSAIKSMPVSTLVQTVRQVLKTPPNYSGGSSGNVEVSILKFFYFYLQKCSPKQVFQSWSNLSALLKDCLVLAPPAIFLALAILSQFVNRMQQIVDENVSKDDDGENSGKLDRKDSKELQDLAEKLINACTKIAGSYLEQTAWLRKNFVVNTDLQEETNDELESDETFTVDAFDPKKPMHYYAVPALLLLADLLAQVLDIIFPSDEKDKVIPILNNALVNVFPYLRSHNRANQASFCAASKLLASLSEYQCTRKAWKREGLELLLDPAFFQMDLPSIIHWERTVDNLMTQDKKSIQEFLLRVGTISVGLFATKDQEMEQRALLIKRLSFVIFSSEKEQHDRLLKQIYEILLASLRLLDSSPNPVLHSALFLCFRVLLVRMRPENLSSIWPMMISEMIQIFKALEYELITDSEKCRLLMKRLSNQDSSSKSSTTTLELTSKSTPAYLALFLHVCKVLDLCLALPASVLPQFQMFSWGFVSEGSSHLDLNGYDSTLYEVEQTTFIDRKASYSSLTNGSVTPTTLSEDTILDFVPHVVRVSKPLLKRFGHVEPLKFCKGQLQLRMKSIQTLEDLAPFLASVCSDVTRQQAINSSEDFSMSELQEQIDSLLELDFIETIPAK